MSPSTRSIVILSGIVVLLFAVVMFVTPLLTKKPTASVAGGACIPLNGTYNPSIPPPRRCCKGLKAVLQNPGCPPGGCHYICQKSGGTRTKVKKH